MRLLPEFLESLPESIPQYLWDFYLRILSLFVRVSHSICDSFTWVSCVSFWEYNSVCLWETYLSYLSLFLRVSNCICDTFTRVSWVSSLEYPTVSMRLLPEFFESFSESIPLYLWDFYLSFLSLILRVSKCVFETLPEFLEFTPESIPVCVWDTYLFFLSLILRVSQCFC